MRSEQFGGCKVDFLEGPFNLLVTEIGEPTDNTLRIVVAEGRLGEAEAIKFDDVDLGDGCPIEVTSDSQLFELMWDQYVAYAVRNECFSNAELQEALPSKPLNRRFNSAFLHFVSATTFADDDYPGPLQHWALSTLNHCIDVVSVQPPRIRSFKARGNQTPPSTFRKATAAWKLLGRRRPHSGR